MMNFYRLFVAAVCAATSLVWVTSAHSQLPTERDSAVYRGDTGHSGYSATSLPPVLSVLWQNTLPGVTNATSTPALVNGVLYLGAGPHVYALNAKDGSIKWQYPADGSAAPGDFSSPPAVADGKVFIGSNSNNLSVFDTSTGALLWQINTSGYVDAAPVVFDGTVFFGSTDKHLYAVKEADQQPLWGGVFRTGGPVFSSPCIADGMVWFGDGNGSLYGVKEATGGLQWTFLPTGGLSQGSPVYRNDVLYASAGSSIISIFYRSGALKSAFVLPSIVSGPPTVDDSNIFASTSNSDIICLNLRGTTVWRTHLEDIVASAMQITDTYLYAISRSGVIYALDPATGKIIWSYALQNAIVQPGDTSQMTTDTLPQARTNAACLAQNGALYTVTNDGTVTAFTGSAPDNIAPEILAVNPQPDSTIAGANVQFQIFVTDIGSGINPKSVSLTIDGARVPVIYDPTSSLVALQFDRSKNNVALGRIVLPTLPDGQRTAELKIADWRGNVMTKKWSFTVDNTLNPDGSPAPTPITPNSFQQGNSNAAASSTNGNGDAGAGSVTYPGGSVPSSPSGSSPTTGAAPSSPGSGGMGQAPVNPPPSAPPGTAGGSGPFPPPPPI